MRYVPPSQIDNTHNTVASAQWTHFTVVLRVQGEVLEGSIACKPNEGNPRDLDITISYEFNGDSGSVKATMDYKMR